MESPVLNEQVEWEMRRVAVAFGMQEWTHYYANPVWHCTGRADKKQFAWQLSAQTLKLTSLSIAEKGARTTLAYFLPDLGMRSGSNNALMSRGLYCLGIETENTSVQLPTLSAHEKMELRLSMPHEFWPQKWIDGENAAEI